MITDARVNRFFFGVDMAQHVAKQKAFLTLAFGGPHLFTGLDMRQGHAHLVVQGLQDQPVDRIIEHLGDTLKALGVAQELIAEVAAIAEGARNDVLGR